MIDPKMVFRCALCKEPMETVAVPFTHPANGCNRCREGAHVHIRCTNCSEDGAYFTAAFSPNGDVELQA